MNLNAIRQQILARAAQSESFRARLMADTKAVVEEETGWSIPEGFSIAAHDDPGHGLQLAVSGAAALSDDELAEVAGGGFMGSQYETEAEADAAWEAQYPGSTPPWKE